MSSQITTRVSYRTITLVLLGMMLLASSAVDARSVDVEVDGRTARLTTYRDRDIEYVSLKNLLEFLGARVTVEPRTRSLVSDFDGHYWQFWGGSVMVGRGDDVFVLGDPVIVRNRELAVPVTAIVAIINQYANHRLEWLPDENRLLIFGGRYNVTGYTIDHRDNGILVEFGLTEELPYEFGHSEGNWINLTVHDARLDEKNLRLRRRSADVREIKVHQFENSAQISVRMRRPFEKYFATISEKPRRLSLLVQDEKALDRAASRVAAPPASRRSADIQLVAIDPGHGGEDHGVLGRKKDWSEKDIAMSIARFVESRFDGEDDIRTILTREADQFTPLPDRIALTNEANADLCISIHVNISPDPNDVGSQTFFWAPATNEEGVAVALRENTSERAYYPASARVDDPETRTYALEYQQQSADLAQCIQAEFERGLDIPSRGVDQAELDILAQLDMPAVVIECAFISNPKEERLLRKEKFQKRIAEAIYRGILAYVARTGAAN